MNGVNPPRRPPPEHVAPIVVGLLIDWWLRSAPWATLVGVAVGFVVGGVRVRQIVRRLSEMDQKPKAGPP